MLSRVHLKCFDEIVGQYKGIERSDCETAIAIGDLKVVFPTGSAEAEVAMELLGEELMGTKIGLIRIDRRDKPLRVRTVKSQ